MSDSELGLPAGWQHYKEFFKFIKITEKDNFLTKCKLCPNQTISVSKNSSYNMRLHLQRKHPQKLHEVKKRKERENIEQDGDDAPQTPTKQLKLDNFQNCRKIPSDKIHSAVINWVIDSAQPFQEIERPSFIQMMAVASPGYKLMSKKTLVKKIEEKQIEMKNALINLMTDAEYVGVTADCWSSHHRSFLGITAHWIDSSSLTRKAAALACRRIIGKHTHDVLANAIQSVLTEYKIQNKVTSCTTDNARNFEKAFRIFGKKEEDEDVEDDFNVNDISEIFENEDFTEVLHLPNHERCACHTLNLVATKDIENVQGAQYRSVLRKSLAKCQALWNKQNQSTVVADTIRTELKANLIVPCVTRWSSMFKSVNCLNKHIKKNPEAVHKIFDMAGLSRLSTKEVEFLAEYAEVLEPLARAIDILQGENETSMGFLLPTLYSVLEKLNKKENLQFCDELAKAVVNGIKKRFKDVLWRKDLVLAACTHPYFKLTWIPQEKLQEAKSWINDYENKSATQTTRSSNDAEFGGFFQISDSSSAVQDHDSLSHYLSTPRTSDKSVLLNNSYLKSLYIKFNTDVPSSAAVERLFSYASEVFQKKRTKLTDTNLENQLLLKVNLKLTSATQSV